MVTRIFYLGLLMAAVIAIPLSHSALSNNGKGPAPKVKICHFPDDQPGHVIEVSAHAVPAHIEKHGDCKLFVVDDDTGDCRCLTCREQCDAGLRACLADCPDFGTGQCQAECNMRFQRCLALCDGNRG